MEKERLKNARNQLIKKIGYDEYWEFPASKRLEYVKKYIQKIYSGQRYLQEY